MRRIERESSKIMSVSKRIACFGRRGGEAACSKGNTSVFLERKKFECTKSSDEVDESDEIHARVLTAVRNKKT